MAGGLMLISSFIQPNTNQSERYNLRGNSDVGMKTDHLSFPYYHMKSQLLSSR